MKNILVNSVLGIALVAIYQFVMHGVLLAPMYEETAQVWRPVADMDSLHYISIICDVLMTVSLVLLVKKFTYKNCQESVLLGAGIGLINALTHLSFYAFLPIPFSLSVCWFVGCLGQWVILSLLIGCISSKCHVCSA